MIEFFLPMKKVPTTTHQQKKVRVVKGKPQFYEDDKLATTRAKYMSMLWPYTPEEQLSGAIRLTVKWCFGTADKKKFGKYKTTKPDTDNLNKLLKDCLSDCGYWKDDALVASEIIEKFWAEVPGIYIKIEEL